MRINSYEQRKTDDVNQYLAEYRASLEMLEALKIKGFNTINEAWRSICKTQCTKRELDKFASLLGDKIEARKDSHSWDWFTKWGGTRHVEFKYIGETWKDNRKVLSMSIKEDLNVERHHCGGSYNIEEHTIDSLIETCKKSIKEYEEALPLLASIPQCIADYEKEIEEAVSRAYDKHIKQIDSLVYSKSI